MSGWKCGCAALKKMRRFLVAVIDLTVHFCDAGKAFTLQVMCPSAPAWEAPNAFGASHAGAIFPAEQALATKTKTPPRRGAGRSTTS